MKRTIFLYTGFQFFFSLLLWLPIYYEYQRLCGLGDPEIFFIQTFYYVVFCILEIPTGLFADRFGTRLSLRVGAWMLVLSNFFAIFSPTYSGFFAHFILVALARSFVSGASSAYLYDFLTSHGRATEYKRIEGSARAYALIGKVVGWAGMGAVMAWDATIPYWLTTLSAGIAVVFAYALPLVESSLGISSPVRERLFGVAGVLQRSPLLVLLMIQGVALFVLARIGTVDLFQPILKAKSFDLAMYGLLLSAITVFEAVGSARHSWLQRWLDDVNAVFVVTSVMAVLLLLIPHTGQVGTVVLLGLFSYLCGVSFPIQRQLMNDHIPDSRFRATLLSVESIVDRAVCALVAAQMGGFLQQGRLDSFLSLSALFTFVSMIGLYVALRGRPRKNAVLALSQE